MTRRVCYDPGHGGSDPGATGNGLRESDVVLAIGLETEKILLRDYFVEVSLTRRTDTSVSYARRCEIANNFGANMFVSGHINSFGSPSANGFESFRWNGLPTGHMTEDFHVDLHSVVRDYVQSLGVRDRGMKQANFYVLRNTRMPAILIEYMFLSNPREAELLKDSSVIKGLAEATAEGIAKACGLRKKEADKELLSKIVIYNGTPDEWIAREIHEKLGVPMAVRKVAEGWDKKVAEEAVVVGGGVEGLEKIANSFVDLSGSRREDTWDKSIRFYRSL